MPKTCISGINGSFSMVGCAAKIASWSSDSMQDLHDVTGFDSNGWREAISGLKMISGVCSGYLQSDDTGTDPFLAFTGSGETTGVAGTLTMRTGCTITGTFLVSRKTVGTDVNGSAIFSAMFRSTGAISTAWDTTS